MKILQEFKTFAMKGNVVDLAVGFIIGTAFGKIVSSLVADVIMPPIGLLVGGKTFTNIKIYLGHNLLNPSLKPVSINIGNFIQVVIDFLLIAFSVFLLVKVMNSLKKKEEQPPAVTPPSKEEQLLTEIRDLLKK